MEFFDSHAHLNLSEFDPDREAALQRAREAGVSRMMNVGVDAASSRAARDLARRETGLYAAAAVHPNYVEERGEAEIEEVRALVEEGGFSAVGETGLDFYRDRSSRAAQIDAFEAHLDIAFAAGLPVVVHCRHAQADCLSILANRARGADLADRIVMHCFGGSEEEARSFLDLGAVLSFSGILTFKNAEETRRAARAAPLDRILVETDCPYLAPHPLRGRKNEPAYVAHFVTELARVKEIPAERAAEITTANACRVLGVGGATR